MPPGRPWPHKRRRLGCWFFSTAVSSAWLGIVFWAASIPCTASDTSVAQLCTDIRLAFRQVGRAGLAFHNIGLPDGQMRTDSPWERRKNFYYAVQNVSQIVKELQNNNYETFSTACLASESSNSKAAGELTFSLYTLLTQRYRESRKQLESQEVARTEDILGAAEGVAWSQLLHSGWPVFQFMSLTEFEMRSDREDLVHKLLQAEGLSEGCSYADEELRRLTVLIFGEGRTMKISDTADFFRQHFRHLKVDAASPELFDKLIWGDIPELDRCPIANAVTFAALADALQCHWHRPNTVFGQVLADAFVDRSQKLAKAALRWSNRSLLLSLRWPLFGFLGRLDPPFPRLQDDGPDSAPRDVIVSWSTREAGGRNWASEFAWHVFGHMPGVTLIENFECADIYIFRTKLPINFGGVLVFVDGERSPDDSLYQGLLASYPASIVVGPMSPGGFADFFPVPFASTSFGSRENDDPRALLETYWERTPLVSRKSRVPTEKRRFAAYLAWKCWHHRDLFFRELNRQARAAGLEGVSTLSRCGNITETREGNREDRYSATFLDDAVNLFRRFKFAMVFENRLSPRYVTEKIVNAFLAGAVPIYWGTPYVYRLFNPGSFIYVNSFIDFAAAARHVVATALDMTAYTAYLREPPLRRSSDAFWTFSWHRQIQPLEVASNSTTGARESLRSAIAASALRKVEAGSHGTISAHERRPWEYVHLFEGL